MNTQEINNNSNLDSLINKFFEYFQCAVCMNDLKCTFITKECAHRFCEHCIKECIDTLHKCPLCNRQLDTHNDVVKDVQYDDLLLCIKELKSKNEDKLFKSLVEDAFQTETIQEEVVLSPLENVLKKHLLKVLNTHETYYKQLEKHYLNELKHLNERFNDNVLRENESLIKKFEIEKLNLKIDFEKSKQLICEVYDKYLTDNTPKPSLFPVKLKVKVLHKKLNIENFVLKPNDDIGNVFTFIENYVQAENDKIVEYPKNLTILCIGPFSRIDFKQIEDIYKKYEETNILPDDIHTVKEKDCRALMEYSIKPGSQLVICGALKFESDLPAKCFTKTFDKDSLKTVDYYSCTTCNLKWICKNCKLDCHKDHDTALFILGHKPTWACCYCKRVKCHLINN